MKLTNKSKLSLQLILNDPQLIGQLLVEGDLPKKIVVNDDGSITFYRNKNLSFFEKLFKSRKTIPFTELAVIITNVFGGIGNCEHAVKEGLKSEFVDTLFNGDKNRLIEAWTLTYFVKYQDGSGTNKMVDLSDDDGLDLDRIGHVVHMVGEDGRMKKVMISVKKLEALRQHKIFN